MLEVVVMFNGKPVCVAEAADSFLSRGVGLLGRRTLLERRGLLIQRCGSIHTWFMRFAIDVVYLGKDGVVTKTRRDMQPFRMSFGGKGTLDVLELPAGTIARLGIERGCSLELRPVTRKG